MKDDANTIVDRKAAFLCGRRFPDGALIRMEFSEGRITHVEPVDYISMPSGIERWITPGFFDLQVNGFADKNFIDPQLTIHDVAHIARMLLRTGTTHFLPTVVTAELGTMCRQLKVIADAMDQIELVSVMCPGIHLEGPFIHPEDGPRGAHPREHVRLPSIEDYDLLADAARGKIALITLAPDRRGALKLIRHAVAQGVLAAIGHHRAEGEVLEAAINAGVRMSTHLGNGCDAKLDRHDNYVWQQLGDDRLWASFISDGHHLPPATLRCMLRAKTPARSVLITDAIGAAGMQPGRYMLGQTEIERTFDGKVILPGTPYQAGSAADMPMIIARAVIYGGVSFVEAVKMASIQPVCLLTGSETPWSCEPGQPADLVELDWHADEGHLTVRQVVTGRFSVHAVHSGS